MLSQTYVSALGTCCCVDVTHGFRCRLIKTILELATRNTQRNRASDDHVIGSLLQRSTYLSAHT